VKYCNYDDIITYIYIYTVLKYIEHIFIYPEKNITALFSRNLIAICFPSLPSAQNMPNIFHLRRDEIKKKAPKSGAVECMWNVDKEGAT